MMIEEVSLETVPIIGHEVAEGTLVRVVRSVTTAVHVEECPIAEHRSACTNERRLPLAEIGKDLVVGKLCQRVHCDCTGGRRGTHGLIRWSYSSTAVHRCTTTNTQ